VSCQFHNSRNTEFVYLYIFQVGPNFQQCLQVAVVQHLLLVVDLLLLQQQLPHLKRVSEQLLLNLESAQSVCMRLILMLSSYLYPGCSDSLVPQSFPTNFLCVMRESVGASVCWELSMLLSST
jgi:hypothetical protein